MVISEYSQGVKTGHAGVHPNVVLVSFYQMRIGDVLAHQIVLSANLTRIRLNGVMLRDDPNSFSSSCIHWFYDPKVPLVFVLDEHFVISFEDVGERDEVVELGMRSLFPVEVDPQAVFPAHLPAAGEVREALEPVQLLCERLLRRNLPFSC